MGSIVIIPSSRSRPNPREGRPRSRRSWLQGYSLPYNTPAIPFGSRESGCSGLIWTGAAIRRTMPVAIGNSLLDCDSRGNERIGWIIMLSRPRIPNVALLVVGLLLGWGLANIRPAQIQAGGGDRS